MKRLLRGPVLVAASIGCFLCLSGFSSVGEFQLPVGSEATPSHMGLSLSSSMLPCMGCSSNSDEYCFLWGGDVWFGFQLHEMGSLRFRFSAMDGRATQGKDGDHHDFSGNLYLGAGAEYMLSSRSGKLALLAGAFVNLWKRNNRYSSELLAFTPYIGGILAFRDPGLLRPYLSARLGAAVYPDILPYASLTAGLQIPLRGELRLMTELIATLFPGEGGLLPAWGVGVGLLF